MKARYDKKLFIIIFKQKYNLINNKLKHNSREILAFNDITNKHKNNYFAIGKTAFAYFYQIDNDIYVNISPLMQNSHIIYCYKNKKIKYLNIMENLAYH